MTRISWRNAFYVGAAIFLIYFGGLVWSGIDGQFLTLLAAFICLIAARFDDIAKFKLSKDGLEGEMQQVIDEARATLAQLHSVAETQSKMILWSMQAQGRFGGFTFDSENEMRKTVVANLEALGVSQAKIDDVLSIEYRYIEHDYSYYVINAVDHAAFSLALTEAWNKFFSPAVRKGIGFEAKPDELEAFFTEWNILNDDLIERLVDYRHFITTRRHRRPEAWRAARG